MIYDIICYFMQFSMYGPWFLHTYFLIYDFKCLSDLGPGSLKKESERVFGDCFRYVWSFLFHICFLRKTKFYMPCVFSVWFLLHFCVCVTDSLRGVQQWNIQVCSYGQVYFSLGFWAISTGSRQERDKRSRNKGVGWSYSFNFMCVYFSTFNFEKFQTYTKRNGKINSYVCITILINSCWINTWKVPLRYPFSRCPTLQLMKIEGPENGPNSVPSERALCFPAELSVSVCEKGSKKPSL